MDESHTEHYPVPNPNLYKFANRVVFGSYFWLQGGVSYCGEENLENLGDDPYILASVHRAWDEPALLANTLLRANGTQAHFMAKKEIWDWNKLAGWFVETTGAFPVDRSEDALNVKAFKYIKELIRKNGIIATFPEGKRFSGRHIDRDKIKPSVGTIAIKYGLPVVPVGIAGSEYPKKIDKKTGEEKSKVINFIKRRRMHVVYGRSIEAPRVGENANNIEKAEQLKTFIAMIHFGMQETLDTAFEHRDDKITHR